MILPVIMLSCSSSAIRSSKSTLGRLGQGHQIDRHRGQGRGPIVRGRQRLQQLLDHCLLVEQDVIAKVDGDLALSVTFLAFALALFSPTGGGFS
jgi:hypothetical protein